MVLLPKFDACVCFAKERSEYYDFLVIHVPFSSGSDRISVSVRLPFVNMSDTFFESIVSVSPIYINHGLSVPVYSSLFNLFVFIVHFQIDFGCVGIHG